MLTPVERRIIANHQDNLKSVADSFKDAIERDKSRAPQSMREDAFSGMWHFSKIRKQIPTEVKELEQYIYDFGPGPLDEELNMRLMRISLALYFLDKLDEYSEAVRKRGGMQITSLFTVMRVRIERLLDEDYFSKTSREILGGFLDAQPSLLALSKVTPVKIHEPFDAVNLYHPKVCDMIDDAKRARLANAG